MDRILLREFSVAAIVGVEEAERSRPQELRLALALETDLARAAFSDDLADAVDYAAITAAVTDHVAASRFRLLEAVAGSTADLVLREFPAVAAVTVTVDKPSRGAAVELRRLRQR